LTEALAKLSQTPLVLYPTDKYPDNENVFRIYIKMTGTYFILYHLVFKMKKCLKIRLENVFEDRLLIKLPIRPSTIEELALIRFWLLKLSQAHFVDMYAHHGILNHEFLSVLSPRTRKILFHANDVDLEEFVIPADFAQFICARRIFLQTTLIDRHNLFKFISGTGNALEKVFIDTFGIIQGEFCKFLVKVSFDHRYFLFQNLRFSLSCTWKQVLKVCLKSSSAMDVVEEAGQISLEQNSLARLMVPLLIKSTATQSIICGTRKLRFALNYMG
jgi:hypothetical protein